MSEVVCQVSNRADRVEFIWSSRGGFFRPYVVSGAELAELRQAADQTRVALESLVFVLNQVGAATPGEPSIELAEAGFRVFNYLLPTEDETARKVRHWLEDLRKQSGLIGLEIVVEEQSADPKAILSVPWNLVYDERPAKHKAEFQKGQGVERWRPFWSVRYNLTSGRRVEPLKRVPTWSDPRVVVVVDPAVHEGLDEEQRGRLDAFLAEAGLAAVGSMDELEAALEEGYPRLLYWLGHATPEYLMLGDERIAPGDLRNLLRSFDDRERPEGMLAFLNACQTAEAGSGGSFLEVLHDFGFSGAIATERQTIDNFANEFGLSFLRGFLREGKPLGELLHGLRLRSAPLGLLYGAHCPPEIKVRTGSGAADLPVALPINESGPVAGTPLGAAATPGRRKQRRDRRAPRRSAAPPPAVVPPLPGEPYRSLAFYDEADRALFTGRDADVVRFAATLDRPDTRILILHGESGTGKSSFLRAGVIPYLEGECVGYRFFRRGDGSVLIVQAAKDLVGGLAQALLDATATPHRHHTPDGEAYSVNLRRVLDEALGSPADHVTLREALRHDPHLLADVLARMAARLPHALVLVIDQAEEAFTLAKGPEEVAGRDHALRMIQRLADTQADVKLIVSLRTEYYGRLLDHLRAGRRDLAGVRDDLLRDFSKSALIDAIIRPTSRTPLVPGQPSPLERYGFRYAEGIPEAIADGVLAMRTENQDSVLPLAQVICTQLYQRETTRPGMDGVITREDLEAIKGVEGGLRAFAEDALERSMRLGIHDREAFKGLFSQLYNRQPDGTLTTWMMPRERLEAQWDRPTPFADLLEAAKSVRLLREDELRIEGGEPRRYVRLGHDALAKVAAAWQGDREEQQRLAQEKSKRRHQFRRMLIGSLVAGFLAVLFASGSLLMLAQNRRLTGKNIELAKATSRAESAEREARRGLYELCSSYGLAASRQGEHAEALLLFARAAELAIGDPPAEELNRTRVANWMSHVARPVSTFAVPEFRFFQSHFRALAFHPAGQYLLTQTDALRCDVWDVKSGEARPLPGGERPISTSAWSPDGWRLALGTPGGVEVFTFPGGEIEERLDTEGAARVLAFSPDGRYLAWGGHQVARVWDRREHSWATPPLEHPREVVALSFDSRGDRLATACLDQRARIFSVPGGGTPTAGPIPHGFHEFGVSHGGFDVGTPRFVDGDRALLTVSYDAKLLWSDATTGRAIRAVNSPSPGESLTALSVSPDGKMAAAVWVNGGQLLDAATGLVRANFEHRHYWAEDVEFDWTSRMLLTSGLNTKVRLWSLDGKKEALTPLHHPVDHPSGVVRARFSPQGGLLATAQWDGRIIIWQLPSGIPARYAIDSGGFSRVALDPENRLVLATSTSHRNSTMQSTSVREASGGSPAGPALRPGGILLDAVFSPDGRRVATASSVASTPAARRQVNFRPGGHAGSVQLWDWSRGLRLIEPVQMPGEPRGLVYRSDGGLLAAICADGIVMLLDPSTGEVLRKLDSGLPRDTLGDDNLWWANGAGAFSPDGRRLATWGLSKSVEVWEVDVGRRIHQLPHDERIHEAVFSADGQALLTASRDNQARLWDLRTGRLAVPALRHPRLAVRARFIENGSQILTLCDDGFVRRWDRETGRLLAAHDLDLLIPQDFAFSLDQRVLTAAGINGVAVLDWRTGEAIAPNLRDIGGNFLSVRSAASGDLIVSGNEGRLIGYPLATLRRPLDSPAAEQRLLAELISGQRVQETGVLVPLTTEEWLGRWRRLGNGDRSEQSQTTLLTPDATRPGSSANVIDPRPESVLRGFP